MQKRKSLNNIIFAVVISLIAPTTIKAAISETAVQATVAVALGGEMLAQRYEDRLKGMRPFANWFPERKQELEGKRDLIRYGSRAIALVMGARIVVKALR